MNASSCFWYRRSLRLSGAGGVRPTLGLRSVMFTVENVDDTVARLRAHGAKLVGDVAQYEDKYRLCYLRGPAGIIVALAEELF